MNLDGLLNASLELEKRIQTDRMLRRYLSNLWGRTSPGRSTRASNPPSTQNPEGSRSVTFNLPPEMCELLELASKATGKSQTAILEESFADYYLKHIDGNQTQTAP